MTNITLSHFTIGNIIKIVSINDNRLKQRLLGFGICPGSIVQLKDIAPLGDPFIITNDTVEIAIRKNDLEFLECELCQK